MSHLFELKINQLSGNAEILLDGLNLASQSQLRVCYIEYFFKWYKALPSMLLAEVNDDYEVKVECCDVQYCLLSAVLSQSPQCRNIIFVPTSSKYSMEERWGWMLDAAKELGVNLPAVPSIAFKNNAAGSRGQVDSLPDRYRKIMNTGPASFSITVVSSFKEAELCMTRSGCEDDTVIVVDDSAQGISVTINNYPIFLTDKKNLAAVIKQWIDLNLFLPYIEYGHRLLSRSNKKTSFLCDAKVKMLIREQPIVKSRIPDRIECGQKVAISLDEFPLSTLSVHISDPSVLVQNGPNLLALKSGNVELSILSDTKETLCKQKISVFFIERVKSIDLSIPDGQTLLEGQRFKVIPTLKPSSAENKNKAFWKIDNGILKDMGNGNFKAIKSGHCTITLTIEKVARSIDVVVYPLPKDIQMPSNLKARVNKTTASFSATLLPTGSACKSIDVRIKDTSIARWDPTQKKVIPVSEGNTELVVSGFDTEGNVVVQKTCHIESLPEKATITPPFLSTLSILCFILAALTYHSELFIVCILVGLVLSIVAIISGCGLLNKNNNKIDLTIGVIGCFIFGAIAAWAFSIL